MSDNDKNRAEYRTEPQKRGVGHPKYVIPEVEVNRVIRAIRKGKSEVSIARALRINYRTWMRVRDEDERIASALSETRRLEEDELVGLLMDKARAGDTTSIIFALKGRHGYRDNGTPKDGDDRVNVTINLPGANDMDSYMKSVGKDG
ncbi:hypothetical protein WJS89_02800 [Sphingomicrobium sp. XHP0235]|uniref:hypothetical protein n=1 Tax=Sphingomicrobium aquimarinum TaxID=3133971 RepID=UPI0031FF40A5